MTLTAAMQQVTFTLTERLVLTPRELSRSGKHFVVFAFAALIYAGFGPGGVNISRAMSGGWQLLVLGLAGIACGSLIAPLLPAGRLPGFVPGWLLGGGATAALVYGAGLGAGGSWYLDAACFAFFPAAAGFLSLRFRDASPSPVEPGLAREKRLFTVLAVIAGIATAAALVLAKVAQWPR
jgi:hypothetical protein